MPSRNTLLKTPGAFQMSGAIDHPGVGSYLVRVIIFDVDGTLCDTNAVDAECYLQAVGEALGQDVGSADWSVAPHMTDSGILDWLFRTQLARPPSRDETAAVVFRFGSLLQAELRRSPERFAPIGGAPEAIDVLCQSGRSVVIATGGYKASTRLKLRAAGLPQELLRASSDDSQDRGRIFALAVERAEAQDAASKTKRDLCPPIVKMHKAKASTVFRRSRRDVVLVGDAIWDVEVARMLGFRFVGVAASERADKLQRAGASAIVPNYLDMQAFDRAITTSRVPS